MTYKCGECGSEKINTWKSGEIAPYNCKKCGNRGNITDDQ